VCGLVLHTENSHHWYHTHDLTSTVKGGAGEDYRLVLTQNPSKRLQVRENAWRELLVTRMSRSRKMQRSRKGREENRKRRKESKKNYEVL
jgi:thiamine monophosphate kinase